VLEMIDPAVRGVIADAMTDYLEDNYTHESISHIAHAIIGALAVNGYAIIGVDPETMRRVVAELSKGD
jgi:UDP-N-acetylmuramyl pentapeptide synthase